MSEKLSVVSDDDVVIGEEERNEIHRLGLRHREVHVYFFIPGSGLILQLRAEDKDTYPGMFDATVGGHVDIGENYEEAAVRETEEETGIKISPLDLLFIKKVKKDSLDKASGKKNFVFASEYLYIYRGQVDDLRVEAGKATRFESWSLARLAAASEIEVAKFIPYIYNFAISELRTFIRNLGLD